MKSLTLEAMPKKLLTPDADMLERVEAAEIRKREQWDV
jgi:hypothetical protein